MNTLPNYGKDEDQQNNSQVLHFLKIFPMSAASMRLEPKVGYVLKIDSKKNLGGKGLQQLWQGDQYQEVIAIQLLGMHGNLLI